MSNKLSEGRLLAALAGSMQVLPLPSLVDRRAYLSGDISRSINEVGHCHSSNSNLENIDVDGLAFDRLSISAKLGVFAYAGHVDLFRFQCALLREGNNVCWADLNLMQRAVVISSIKLLAESVMLFLHDLVFLSDNLDGFLSQLKAQEASYSDQLLARV